jgi:hypothetical protein
MALRQSTIDNSLNRRRFVCEAAAFPYLRNRERQNARRGWRETKRALEAELRASSYGTSNVQLRTQRIVRLTQRLERYAAELCELPTVAELKVAAARRERLLQWRAAQGTDQLAVAAD